MSTAMGKLIFCILFMFAISSCSSGLKKSCESTNWYERGQNMAKKGNFPDADFYLKKCSAAGASINHQQLDRGFKSERERICKPSLAKQSGREGSKYNYPLCFNYNEAQMKISYKKGLSIYCSPANAKMEGSKGKVYKNVCPENKEPAFLASYKLAYNNYINRSLDSKKKILKETNEKISLLKKEQKKLKLEQLNYGTDRVNHKIQAKLKTINFKIHDLNSEVNELEEIIENLSSKK